MIKIGSSRLCIVGKKYTYKLPMFIRGIVANIEEYKNFINNQSIVAYTEYHWWGLKQETLTNLITYDRYVKREDVKKEHIKLFNSKLHSRMQIGQDSKGAWKYFDYEDIKFYLKREWRKNKIKWLQE